MPGHAIIDLRDTYGCALIGLVISLVLFGITILQTWMYYWKYRTRDPTPLKLFIAVILLLDTMHTILCTYTVYWYLILNFGNIENLGLNMWSMEAQIEFNTIVGYLVQIYYARRLYILSKRIAIPVIIVLLGTVCFALGLVFTIKANIYKEFSRYTSLVTVTCVAMGAAVGADLLIAASMCWHLYNKRTGFARTDSMILTLMTYSINSGLLTGIFATAVLITFATASSTMIWIIPFWPLGKCYANSFLAMMNSRDYVRERSTADKPDNAFDLSSIRVEQRSDDDKTTLQRTAVSVTVHRSAATDFPQSKLESQCTSMVGISKPADVPCETRSHMSGSSV